MAATGALIRVPVAVACRVLGLTTQGYYKWLKDPVSQRDWDDAHLIDVLYELHGDDATLGYRFLTDELGRRARHHRRGEPCAPAVPDRRDHRQPPQEAQQGRIHRPGAARRSPRGRRRARRGPARVRRRRPEQGVAVGHLRAPHAAKGSSTSARSRTSSATRSSATPSTRG